MSDDDDIIRFDDESDDEPILAHGEPADVEVRQVQGADELKEQTPSPADSPFDRIRAAYDQRLEVKQLIMEMPGWGGELLIEFGLLSPRDAKQLRSSTRGDRSDMTKVIADLLGLAHNGLSFYDPETGDPAPLLKDGQRATLVDVGEFLPVRVSSARQGLLALFQEGPSRQVNETALAAFANEVGRWMADTSLVVTGAVDQTLNEAGELVAESIDPGS